MIKMIGEPARTILVFLVLISGTFGGVARADLINAQLAYQKGDLIHAFDEFQRLAQLGQPVAQYNLAVMYGRGEGTPKSAVDAYAWAMMADENGHPKARLLADKIRPYLMPDAFARVGQLRTQYSPAALDERLLPKELLAEQDDAERSRCLSFEHTILRYPLSQAAGTDLRPGELRQAGVFVGYTVKPDGATHNWRVLYAIPRNGFDRTVRANLISFHPKAAAQGSAPLECTAMFMFAGENSGVIASIGRIEHAFAHKTLMQAQNGEPLAELHYAMMIQGYPEIGAQRKEAIPWFLKAAQSGSPEAQFVLGYCLLKGIGVQRDENKGEFWLGTAAAGGEPEAQAVLAAYTLRDRSDTESIKRAMGWLDEAVTGQSPDGTLYLSGLLATAPDKELRDPQRSLKLLEKIQKNFDQDPRAMEIRAAAAADLGRQSDAIKDEESAIGMAQKLGWELAPLAGRLRSYREGKAWSGDLVGW